MPSASWRTACGWSWIRFPRNTPGLDGTEIAISESQERMAVVIAPENVDQFLAYAAEENLEAVPVAVVTEDPRLVLVWRGKEIVNLSRAFLNTNGAHQETNVAVEIPSRQDCYLDKIALDAVAADLEKDDVEGGMAGYVEGSECLLTRRDWWRCLTVPSARAAFICLMAGSIS